MSHPVRVEGAPAILSGALTMTGSAIPFPTGKCQRIWFGAPGASTNSANIYVGDKTTQTVTVVPTDLKGYSIQVQEGAMLYAKGTASDKLNYVISQ